MTTATKPSYTVNFAAIRSSAALKALRVTPRWVCWKYIQRGGKWTKPPVQPSGQVAKSTVSDTWSSYADCRRAVRANGHDLAGVGFVLADDGLVGIDLDAVLDQQGAIVDPAIAELVAKLGSYTEISPSGRGLRCLIHGQLPEMPDGKRGFQCQIGQTKLEIYASKRFLTLTGQRFADTPDRIAKRQQTLNELVRVAPKAKASRERGTTRKSKVDHISEVTPELRGRFDAALAADPNLKAVWQGEAPTGADKSRSAHDLKLAGAMRRHGGFSAEEFSSLAATWQHGKGADGDARHFDRTWNAAEPQHAYAASAAGLFWKKPTKDGSVPVQLTNFDARVTAAVSYDENLGEPETRWSIEASYRGRQRSLEIRADQFSGLHWVPEISVGARVFPGLSQHAAGAIQELSAETAIERTRYGHTGWRQIDGQWLFLHAGGAIGAQGLIEGIDCAPLRGTNQALMEYRLPAPASRKRLAEYVALWPGILELYPEAPTIGAALYCLPLRAIFGYVVWSLLLTGPTGAGKSETAGIALRHFAPGLGARNPPASWHDTITDLEAKLSAMADVLVLADEMEPTNDRSLRHRRESTMSTILQCIGNHSARGRSNSDLGSRAVRRPRIGGLISTSEYVSIATSTMARTLRQDIPLGGVDLALGKELIEAGQDGLFTEAIAHLICHVAADRDRFMTAFRERRQKYLAKAADALRGVHGRTPEPLAELMAGLMLGSDVPGLEGLAEGSARIWKHLIAAGQAQREHLRVADPAHLFMAMIGAALASGEAHLARADRPEGQPDDGDDAAAWGWVRMDADTPVIFRPQGRRIGYVDPEFGEAQLIGPAAYAVAERMAAGQDRSLAIGETTLWSLMKQRGLITRSNRGRTTLRVRIGAQRPRLVCVRLALLLGGS